MLFFALLQTIVATAAAAEIIIDMPPSLTQCESTTLSWSGGSAPYSVFVCEMKSPDEKSCYAELGPVDGNSVPYTVKIPVGEKIRIAVKSVNDPSDVAFTDPFLIVRGNDDSCMNNPSRTSTASGPQSSSDMSTDGDSTAVATIAGDEVSPSGQSSPATLDSVDSSASSSPTSNGSTIASASSTAPANQDAENAGFVGATIPPLLTMCVLGGTAFVLCL